VRDLFQLADHAWVIEAAFLRTAWIADLSGLVDQRGLQLNRQRVLADRHLLRNLGMAGGARIAVLVGDLDGRARSVHLVARLPLAPTNFLELLTVLCGEGHHAPLL